MRPSAVLHPTVVQGHVLVIINMILYQYYYLWFCVFSFSWGQVYFAEGLILSTREEEVH